MPQDSREAAWGPPARERPTARRGRLERAKEAAVELARSGGYDAVTMPKVAERSGVSRANLYQHFASKDHLLAAAFADLAERTVAPPSGRAVSARTAGERVLAYFDQAIARAVAEPNLANAYVRAFNSAPDDVIEAVPKVFVARLEEVLGPSVEQRAEVARVLELVYSALITSVVGRGRPIERMRADLRSAVQVVLGGR